MKRQHRSILCFTRTEGFKGVVDSGEVTEPGLSSCNTDSHRQSPPWLLNVLCRFVGVAQFSVWGRDTPLAALSRVITH